MCGILLSNDTETFKKLEPEILARGPDSKFELEENGFKFLQTVLQIRQPLDEELWLKSRDIGLMILFNGKIFANLESDIDLVYEAILIDFNREISEPLNLEIDLFSRIKNIYKHLNTFRNEYAMVIYDSKNELIYFFTDDIGLRSLGFTIKDQKFTVSSFGYENFASQFHFYCYNIREKTLKLQDKFCKNEIFPYEQFDHSRIVLKYIKTSFYKRFLKEFSKKHAKEIERLNREKLNPHEEIDHEKLNPHERLNHEKLNPHEEIDYEKLNQEKLNHERLNHERLSLENPILKNPILKNPNLENPNHEETPNHEEIFDPTALTPEQIEEVNRINLKKLTIDNKQTFDHVKISNTIIFLLVQSANQKTIDLLRNDKIIFAFSGGIDSFSSVIILNDIFNEKVEFVLINTFFSKQSPDCIQAKLNYRDLKAKMRRKITFVENFVSSRQINQNISLIKKLVRSNNIMDINIGIVHFFTSKVASQYGKVIFTGNGADELFLGYSKYFDHQENGPTTFNYNYFVEKLINIQKDNVFRDDSIFSRNQVEMRSIFLDNVLFLYFFTLLNDLQNILGFEIEDDEITTRDIHLVAKIAMAEVLSDGIENKKTLRKFLTAKGYPNQAHIKKKAMQFGTGLKTIEKEIFYGSLK